MFRFLGLALALFVAFAAAWAWFTGDTRPFQTAYWKSVISGNSITATTANVGGATTPAPATPAPTHESAEPVNEPVKLAFSRVGSPAGRYVTAKNTGAGTMGSHSASDTAGSIMRISSPGGRYVKAPKATMATADTVAMVIKRIGSPFGRYVKAPAMAAPAPKYTVIGSPGGRYVKAPAMAAPLPKYTVISSPGGRYVKAPAPKIARISSPGGRYVKAPAVKKAAPPSKIVRISSPDGRYVKAPAVTTPPRKITRISSPGGRYVKAPAQPRTAASGAVVFPITFEYRKSSFTNKGREAADQLLQYVLTKKYRSITLAGHTDSRGSQSVNMKISKRRLGSVEDHLRDGGYKGKIKLVPKGKSEPFDGVDRSKHSEEELWDLDRRVELVSGR